MQSKSVGGFDLVLGKLYNDFWFNRAEADYLGPDCTKCQGATTLHRLEKLVFAFGKMTVKECDVVTCGRCLHEAVIRTSDKPKQPATKRNLAALFAKLPKTVQQEILGGYKK